MIADVQRIYFRKVPSVDIKSWDIQKFFIVYQTFALSQFVKLTIVTLTSLSCKMKIINILFFLLPTCFDHQKTDSVNNYCNNPDIASLPPKFKYLKIQTKPAKFNKVAMA
jgi:hypothetical protein